MEEDLARLKEALGRARENRDGLQLASVKALGQAAEIVQPIAPVPGG